MAFSVLRSGQPDADLLSGERQFDVVALVGEHFPRDHHDIDSDTQWPLDLADQNGLTVVDARFGD